MRTRSSASSAVLTFSSSSVRTQVPAAIVIAALVLSRSLDGRTRTTERDVRNQGSTHGIVNTITAMPKTAMASSVAGGIRNCVAGGGAVRATAKNAITHS